MKKMRMAQVSRTEDMGPHMRRIILRGEELSDFPLGYESAHFKAVFPRPGQSKPKLGIFPGFKKWMRSYTVRDFNEQTKELTVDFAVNDHQGLHIGVLEGVGFFKGSVSGFKGSELLKQEPLKLSLLLTALARNFSPSLKEVGQRLYPE